MSVRWIVVVDRTSARIFTERSFRLIHTMTNELGRERDRDLDEDKYGNERARLKEGSTQHGYSDESSTHDLIAQEFSRELSDYLYKQHHEKAFDELTLAAEPKMKGYIRSHMKDNVQKIVRWVGKDLGKLSQHEIKEYFQKEEPR